MKYRVEIEGEIYEAEVTEGAEAGKYRIKVGDSVFTVRVESTGAQGKRRLKTQVSAQQLISSQAEQPSASNAHATGGNIVQAPMAGRITRIFIKAGDRVTKGQLLFTLEAMKMENEILSSYDGIVVEIFVAECESVGHSSPLCRIE
ncbi:MAG: biotin/lipoyl-containing protein [bacterium]